MGFLDTGTLPSNPKSDLYPVPASADPDTYLDKAEWNAMLVDLSDLRAGFMAATQFAYTPQGSRPAAYTGGQIYRTWVRTSDKHLMYFDGVTDTDLLTGGGGSGFVGTKVVDVLLASGSTAVAAHSPLVATGIALKTYFRVLSNCSVHIVASYTSAGGATTVEMFPATVLPAGEYLVPMQFVESGIAAVTITYTTSVNNAVRATATIEES